MEEFGILSLIPPIVAIILALTTKDVIISLVSSVAAGALVLAHFNPHGAFVIFWKDLFFTELTVNSWNGELIILVTIIGGFVEILDRSGGARAFGTLAHKVVNNRLKAQLVTWFGGLLIFFSDSANSLILGPIFRPIYDKIKVSREKLSYILDSTSSPICVLIPITTWVAVIAGIIQTEFSRINIVLFNQPVGFYFTKPKHFAHLWYRHTGLYSLFLHGFCLLYKVFLAMASL